MARLSAMAEAATTTVHVGRSVSLRGGENIPAVSLAEGAATTAHIHRRTIRAVSVQEGATTTAHIGRSVSVEEEIIPTFSVSDESEPTTSDSGADGAESSTSGSMIRVEVVSASILSTDVTPQAISAAEEPHSLSVSAEEYAPPAYYPGLMGLATRASTLSQSFSGWEESGWEDNAEPSTSPEIVPSDSDPKQEGMHSSPTRFCDLFPDLIAQIVVYLGGKDRIAARQSFRSLRQAAYECRRTRIDEQKDAAALMQILYDGETLKEALRRPLINYDGFIRISNHMMYLRRPFRGTVRGTFPGDTAYWTKDTLRELISEGKVTKVL